MNPFVLADGVLQRAHRRVFPFEVEGIRYYVKKRVVRKGRFGRLVQQQAYRLTGNILLAPTTFSHVSEAFAHEVAKLQRLAEANMPVPRVMFADKDYMVLEDVGQALHKCVVQEPAQAAAYIAAAMEALAQLHSAGFAHGGAQLKNFTLKDGRVYLIDFEENVEQYPLEDMQIRDVLVFLAYLGRLGIPIDYANVIARYEAARHVLIHDRLFEILHNWLWIRFLGIPAFAALHHHDMKAFIALAAYLSSTAPPSQSRP